MKTLDIQGTLRMYDDGLVMFIPVDRPPEPKKLVTVSKPRKRKRCPICGELFHAQGYGPHFAACEKTELASAVEDGS